MYYYWGSVLDIFPYFLYCWQCFTRQKLNSSSLQIEIKIKTKFELDVHIEAGVNFLFSLGAHQTLYVPDPSILWKTALPMSRGGLFLPSSRPELVYWRDDLRNSPCTRLGRSSIDQCSVGGSADYSLLTARQKNEKLTHAVQEQR